MNSQEQREQNFWELVSLSAEKNNCNFFLKNGEGREIFTDDLDGEDLFGWLIPFDKVKEFEKEWFADNISDKWNDFLTFAIWEKDKNETISIIFKSDF